VYLMHVVLSNLHTVQNTCIQYTYSNREGEEGEELNQRKGEKGNCSQS
jgi:hypothetical protein